MLKLDQSITTLADFSITMTLSPLVMILAVPDTTWPFCGNAIAGSGVTATVMTAQSAVQVISAARVLR